MCKLKATFRAGTSGAPKVHAMELIDQLEPTKRGLVWRCPEATLLAIQATDVAITIRTGIIMDQRFTRRPPLVWWPIRPNWSGKKPRPRRCRGLLSW
jgi:hypothetical protein